MVPETFGESLCGHARQKLHLFEGVCLITSGVKLTQHFRKTWWRQSDGFRLR